jgi:DNA-binding transcriptional LysR family regulator
VQVAQLGEELGVVLYRRDGRQLSITESGQRVAAWARRLDDQTSRFLDSLHGRAEGQPVVLCAGEASYRSLLAPALHSYLQEELPPLRLLVGNAEATTAHVLAGRAHVGVTVVGAAPEGIAAEPIAAVPTLAALPIDHALAGRQVIEPADLEGERLVVPPPGRPHRARIEAVLSGVSWRASAEVQGWDLTVQLVGLGMGLALVNGFVRLPTGVVGIPFPALAPVHYALVRSRHAIRSAGVDRLVDHIRAVGAAWPLSDEP